MNRACSRYGVLLTSFQRGTGYRQAASILALKGQGFNRFSMVSNFRTVFCDALFILGKPAGRVVESGNGAQLSSRVLPILLIYRLPGCLIVVGSTGYGIKLDIDHAGVQIEHRASQRIDDHHPYSATQQNVREIPRVESGRDIDDFRLITFLADFRLVRMRAEIANAALKLYRSGGFTSGNLRSVGIADAVTGTRSRSDGNFLCRTRKDGCTSATKHRDGKEWRKIVHAGLKKG